MKIDGARSRPGNALWVVLLSVVIVGVCAYYDPQIGERDCSTFWLVGRLALHHQSPYDRAALVQLAVAEGLDVSNGQLGVRTPPWSIWPMVPLGFFEGRWAWGIWIWWSAAALLLAVHWTWHVYGESGNHAKRTFTMVAYCFPPVLACLAAGQFGLLIFLGIAGFLRYYEERPWIAGALLVLPAIKPQLLTAFWIALLLWIIYDRRWRVLGGSVGAFAAANAVALLIDPAIFQHYTQSAGTDSAPGLFIPTLAVIFRAVVARNHYWVQFIPAALGAVWGASYYMRNRTQWEWREHGPALLVVSAAVTPHGWFTDEVFVLPAVLITALRAVARPGPKLLPAVALFAPLGLLFMMVVSKVPLGSGAYFWSPLVWLGWYAYGRRKMPGTGIT